METCTLSSKMGLACLLISEPQGTALELSCRGGFDGLSGNYKNLKLLMYGLYLCILKSFVLGVAWWLEKSQRIWSL